jgi:L-threonylcarbamoyladenylate synthase
MTQIIDIDGKNLDKSSETEKLVKAAGIIKTGGTVVFPTETVYGLGANGLDPESVKKIFAAKGRPSDNPMILHISDMGMLGDIAVGISHKAKELIAKYWPGPLTLVLKKSDKVPHEATGGLDTVAVRMPSHPVALKLIALAGVPIAAPSANISGRPSPTLSKHVIEDLYGRVDMILAGDQTEIGLESTVIDLSEDNPVLLRPGSISLKQLEEVLGDVKVDKSISRKVEKGQEVRSPGMKYRHYAPKGDMVLVKGDIERVIYTIKHLLGDAGKEGQRTVAIVPEEYIEYFVETKALNMGSIKRPEEIMTRLYSCLRECDEYGAQMVAAPYFENEDEFMAVNNRLSKAAGHNIIQAD